MALTSVGQLVKFGFGSNVAIVPGQQGVSEMSIPCPPIQWPSMLMEKGPTADPAVLLSGTAIIGSIPFRITAIRVESRLKFMPDCRSDDIDPAYRERLECLLEELAEVADSDHPETVELETGSYALWMTSASEAGATGS
jgi:hypothetical protein